MTAPIVRSATLIAVAFVLIEVSAPSVIGPKVIASLLLLIVPLSVEALGADAVKPPLKVKVPPLAPKARVPVLLKVTALVIVPVLAFRAKLYAWFAVFKVVAVRAPLKAIVPVVLVSVTVAASTAPPKVVPPELVMVRVPISVPMVVVTPTVPTELMTM